ncbi:MAG: hypothetical protein ACTSPY_00745 [Candidatus Helarchaeota archaeon]
MLGDISDEEANELIAIVSENVRQNMMGRSVVESKLFPVSLYIHTATYILYDQTYQYNIAKRLAQKIKPEEIGRRSKTLCAPINQLAMNSFAMLYLHGRAQVLHDNIAKKKKDPNVIVEPEEKKKQTKFILDFWRRLLPNYRNDGKLTAENKKIQILSDERIEELKDQMIPIKDNKELIKKLKRTMAELTIYNFIFQCECRAGIFESGPYYFQDNPDPLIFKEFQYLYTGEDMFGIDVSEYLRFHTIKSSAPVQNIIFGMTLDHNYIKKLEFNDWGTLFVDPYEFSDYITSVGIWTKEFIHPKDFRYPDNLGNVIPQKPEILDDISKFAVSAARELYVLFSKMSYIEKLMLGTNLYTNFLALYTIYGGIEKEFQWTWPYEYARNEPIKTDLINKDDITRYIKTLEKYPSGAHPFLARLFRRKKIHKIDPMYYNLQD